MQRIQQQTRREQTEVQILSCKPTLERLDGLNWFLSVLGKFQPTDFQKNG